jgi:hypothetical protein
MIDWNEGFYSISKIKSLLDEDYEVEVLSPDGYVPVNYYIDKGIWDEYLLEMEDGRTVRVNENHLFETEMGWKFAKDLCNIHPHTELHWNILCDDGWKYGKVIKTGDRIPIVDINVEHENHRYYTNGISSHNTGVGKSLFMCHVASSCMVLGKNVLYITLEMAEEKIAERIDANLLNVKVDELEKLSKEDYDKKVARVKKKTTGKLIIKEYPTASASVTHFRALLNELNLKRNFKPDIIFIDYLNICTSSRIKPGASINSYTYVKSIAEELRGLAVEYTVPIVSATQTTRSGFCLSLDTIVREKNKGSIEIKDINVGDYVLSNTGYNRVENVFDIQKKKTYEIITESGKKIICSEEHLFPTIGGEKSIKTGLSIGDGLYVNISSIQTTI